ncbi:MAG: ABC transporter ATP-binding protein/permease [Firmicutes bacterium]|nr:ABC transporter ATP-binding protein/permease [Bacillota bacterium]
MLELKHISKIYQTPDESITALYDLSLKLDDTGFFSIVGHSGCGKTTLLNIIGGLDKPTSGSLLLNQKDTNNLSNNNWDTYRNHMVGFVFQNYYLIPHLSVLENVMLPLSISAIDLIERKKRTIQLLSEIGLKDKLNKKPNQLSGGQQQRVAIARALINEPDIILADEPTGSLDYESSLDIMNLLKEISKTRLVIMVTHNKDLAHTYSDRVIEIKQGSIVKDSLISDVTHSKDETILDEQKTAKMKLSTSFKISFNNLVQRRYRTLLTAVAASIGILGMTLVLAVAYGFNHFIEDRKTETLNAFPIQVERISYVVPLIDDQFAPNLDVFPESSYVYPSNIQYEYQTINNITADFYTHMMMLDESVYQYMYLNYNLESNFIAQNQGTSYSLSDYVKQAGVNHDYLEENFDIISGRLPVDEANEAVIVVDRYNRISKDIAQTFGFSGNEVLTFDQLNDLSLFWVSNNDAYEFDGLEYDQKDISLISSSDLIEIDIVGIIRINPKFNLDFLRTGIFYTEAVTQMILEDSILSDIVVDQLSSSTSVIDGNTLTTQTKDTLLRKLGYATYPSSYSVFSRSFEDKDTIIDYIRSYNDTVPANDAIEPLDIAGIGLATMKTAIDSISIILLVFSGISLLISNIMIGMMTYTSIIERTKEIGILRSIGARKNDVGFIFYSETLMIGLLSGVIGIILSYALLPLLNLILYRTTTIQNVGTLPILFALILIILNTLLTSLSGIIPAGIASKKDPIVCLRNE